MLCENGGIRHQSTGCPPLQLPQIGARGECLGTCRPNPSSKCPSLVSKEIVGDTGSVIKTHERVAINRSKTLYLGRDCTVFALALNLVPTLAHLPRQGVDSQTRLSSELYSLCISGYLETHLVAAIYHGTCNPSPDESTQSSLLWYCTVFASAAELNVHRGAHRRTNEMRCTVRALASSD